MSSNIALGIAAVAFAALAVTSILLWQSSKRLFAAIAAQDPDQIHLTRWPFFGQYGPLPPAQMSFLQQRRFLQLPEPTLRALGRRALVLVYVYASAFLVLLLSLLWWSVSRGA
jgi:hypothetical protein